MAITNEAAGGVMGAVRPWLTAIRAILFLGLEWAKDTWHVPTRR